MVETPLDLAHQGMQNGGEAERRRFYERLVDAELHLLLEAAPEAGRIAPQICTVEGESYVLVFDLAERLSDFAGGAAEFAAMSGRAVVNLLAGQGLGLALNLGAAPSAILLPASVLHWLAGLLQGGPEETDARPVELRAPAGVTPALLESLDRKLSLACGLVKDAYLADVGYEDGRAASLLALVDARPGAEPALRQAIAEAVMFCGDAAAALDILFLAANDPVVDRLARRGLRIEISDTPRTTSKPPAPGTDPARPPKLR